MKFFLFFIIAVIGSFQCSAGLYPVATIRPTSRCAGPACMIYVTLANREIGNITNMYLPEGKYLLYGFRSDMNDGSKYFKIKSAHYATKIEKNETLGQVAMRAFKKYGSIETFMSTNVKLQDTCPSFAVADSSSTLTPWSSVFIPAGVCDNPPPPPEWCSISIENIVIDHGKINLGATDSKINKSIGVNCSAAMTIELKLNPARVKLADGVLSSLSLPDKGILKTKVGYTHTVLTSTLHLDKSAKAGEYSGISVMSINYY